MRSALQTLDSFGEAPPFELWYNRVLDQLNTCSKKCNDHADLQDAALREIAPNVIHVPDGRYIEDAGIGADNQLWVQSRLYMLNGFHDEDEYTEAVCGLVVDRNDTSCAATAFFGVDWFPTHIAFGRLLFCDPKEREPAVATDADNWRYSVTEKIEFPSSLQRGPREWS